MAEPERSVYFLSDHTGITIEAIGRSLLSQFAGLSYQAIHWPFLDSLDKARRAVEHISRRAEQQPLPPLLFSSLVNPEIRDCFRACPGRLFDVFETFTAPLEQFLGMRSAPLSGQYHGLEDQNGYNTRIHAVHYALENDDGAILRNYGFADLILVGVSRSGKTPTCLYLGLQHGVMAANYPLTEDELPDGQLPEVLLPHRDKLFALTLQPQQLARIRQQRRPNSRYATLDLCRWELAQAEALFARYQIPTIDTTARSIEEIATRLLQHLGLVARMPR